MENALDRQYDRDAVLRTSHYRIGGVGTSPRHGDNGDAMVDDMKTGKYLLTRERFMDTLKEYHLYGKAKYVFDLDQWDAERGNKEG